MNSTYQGAAAHPHPDAPGTSNPQRRFVALLAVAAFGATLLTTSPANAGVVDLLSRLFPNAHTTWVETNRGGREVRIRISGSIEWNAAEDDVQSLTGKAVFQEKANGRTQRIVFEPENGTIKRTYSVDGKIVPMDAAARRWMGQMIIAFNRESGAGAPQRVRRLYASGGTTAVLDDIEHIQSGHALRRHIEELAGLAPLDEKSLDRLLGITQSMDSDFERRVALGAIIDKQSLPPMQQIAALKAVSAMDSSFEQRTVLTKLAPKLAGDEVVSREWFKTLGGMDSDFEMRIVIESLAKREKLTPSQIDLTLKSTQRIDSDFERAICLRAMLRHLREGDQALLDGFLESAKQIDSDFERSNVLITLVNRTALAKPGYVSVLNAIAGMDSDFEIKNALAAVAKKMPADAELVSRYRKVARTLGDHERAQAEKALDHLDL